MKISLVINLILVLVFVSKVYKPTSASVDRSREISRYYITRASQFETLPVVENNILFLGDSIMEGAELSELLGGNVINRGIGGDTTYGVLTRLDDVVRQKPSKIFLLVGINDIAANSPEQDTVNRYSDILKKLNNELPNTEIYVQSVLPINVKKKGNKFNDSILSLNTKIKQLPYKFTYIDLWGSFSSNGELADELTEDGIHINGKGYLIWKEIIKKHLNQA